MLYQTCLAHSLSVTPYLGAYRFEGNSNVGDTFIAGLGVDFSLTDKIAAEFSYLRGNVDLNYFHIDTQRCVTESNINTNIIHVSGRYQLFQKSNFKPYVTAGMGILSMNTDYAERFKDDPDRHYQFQFHYGGGIKYSVNDTISIRGDLRHVISFDNLNNDLAAIVGVSYAFGPTKIAEKAPESQQPEMHTDHDTHKTEHPQTHEPKHEEQHTQSDAGIDQENTPEPEPEPKEDVIQEPEAKPEPEAKEDVIQEPEAKPEPEAKQETQVVENPQPQVPIEKPKKQIATVTNSPTGNIYQANQITSKTAQEDHHISQQSELEHLSSIKQMDSDQDGVTDIADRCPNTPKNVRVNLFGCAPDIDRDGIIDVQDQCPGTPPKVQVDGNGCQVKVIKTPATHHEKEPRVLQITIEFDYKSAQVRDSYHEQISKIIQLMKPLNNPQIIINSHTDNIGSQMYNINLSDKRAQNVQHYLHHHFQLPYHQMKAYSFGETQPIADNRTEAGRQKNRRSEIILTGK